MLIHVMLVSEQILANLIPALMEKPALAYLVTSPGMKGRKLDKRLKACLTRGGIDCHIEQDAPDVELALIHEYAFELVERIRGAHPEAAIVLNATGGTKPMMLGFVEIFRTETVRILYTDTSRHVIQRLPAPRGPIEPAEPMRDVLDVRSYLQAQGFAVNTIRSEHPARCEEVAARKPLAKWMGLNVADQNMQNYIGTMNRLADLALDSQGEQLIKPVHELEKTPWGIWAEALGRLCAASLVKWEGGTLVEFVDAEAARFIHGGWLEEYCWHIVRDAGVFDAQMSVFGQWNDGRDNEFDVLATHRNELLFIECKTLRHGRAATKDSDILYKADSLGDAARGLFGSTWLISAREPTDDMRARAKTQRIDILGPADIPRLRDRVREWMTR